MALPESTGPRRSPFPSWAPVHAVVFDFDGVIADTEWLHSTSFRQVLSEEGIHLTDRDHSERFLGVNDRAGFVMALGEVGRTASPAEITSLVERKSHCYSQRLEEIPLFAGASELIKSLAERCPLAIASGGRGAEIRAVLERHDLIRVFVAVVSADDVRDSKPSPEPFLAALEAIRASASGQRVRGAARGWTPAQCVAIEDSIHGVHAALAAGMRCVAVAHTYPAAKLTEAHRVVERIGQLAAGDILGGSR